MALNLTPPDISELKPRITVFGVGGANIEDMYQDKVVSQYLRDVVYVRPNVVVVYDRTTVSGADKDQWLSWAIEVYTMVNTMKMNACSVMMRMWKIPHAA